MAYNEAAAKRIEAFLSDEPNLEAKKMFGGIGYLINGNMACGVNKEDLIVRVGLDGYGEAVIRPHAGPFDMTGRPMKGWVMVTPGGYESEADLQAWVMKGVEFARSLPAK